MINSPDLGKQRKLSKKELESKANNKQELKNFLNSCQTFAEYFVVIGIDPKLSMRDYLYNTPPNDLLKYYSNEIKPEILSKYPPMEKKYINITSGLVDICFSNGFEVKESSVKPQPIVMNFLLDNYFYSIDHPYKYVTCLKFYESLNSYYKLRNELQKQLGNKYDGKIPKYDGCSINTNKLNFDIEFEDEEDVFKTSSSYGNNKKDRKGSDYLIENLNESNLNNYYFPKVICLISVEPFYEEQKLILEQIYNYHLNRFKIPLEKIILNILCNIPMPPKGLIKIIYKLSDNKDITKFEDIEIKRNEMNKLRNIDKELNFILSKFSNNVFLDLFRFTLYETKTIIFSSSINNLSLLVNGLIDLLFPFKYSFQVSSCVPNNTFNLLESISPYILGINQKYTESFFTDNHIETKGMNLVIVDLDEGEITLKLIEEFPEIPKSLRRNLKDRIEECKKKRNVQDKDENYSMAAPFFEFFANVMEGYDNYLNNDYFKDKMKYKSSSINALFKCKDFINSKPSNEKNFYKRIIESQMFSDFILKRMIPKDRNDKIDILFLDEFIEKKNNEKKLFKKKKLVFLNSKEYIHNHIYNVFKPKELSIEEKSRYENKDYRIRNLYFGQNIEIIKGEKENEKEYFFNYLLFPKLNNDFFDKPNNEYFFSSSLTDINRINSDLISKSHLGSMEVHNADMLNYIYLTYVEIWGYSYWYQDIVEKDTIFKELLKVLDKVYHHELELFNVLFETLSKFQDKEKIMILYNKLIEYKMAPSSYIHKIVSKIMDQKIKTEKLLKSNPNGSVISNTFYNVTNLDMAFYDRQPRTFHNITDSNILGDLVVFKTTQNCPECSKLIDIENISNNYKNMIKDCLWAKCPNCNQYILPQLTVKLGNDLNTKNNITSKETTFTLYSPYELKIHLKETIDIEMCHILDVDKFKLIYPNLFWSCIWYFKLNKINYDLILPYASNMFKSKTSSSNKFIMQININSEIKKERKNKNNDKQENKNKIAIKSSKKKKNKKKYFKFLILQKVISFSYNCKKYLKYYGEFKNKIRMESDDRRNTIQTFHKKSSISNLISPFLNLRKSMERSQQNFPISKKLSGKQINKYLTSKKNELNFSQSVKEEDEDEKVSDFDKSNCKVKKSEESQETIDNTEKMNK